MKNILRQVALKVLLLSTPICLLGQKANFHQLLPIGYGAQVGIKQKLLNGDSILRKDLEFLLADANEMLEMKLLSVMDNSSSPKGVNPHSYVSYAPYWWPNPDTEDGLPYVRRDGRVNQELRSNGDDKAFTKMAASTHILSLAYFYSENEKYAAKASQLLSTWFLDSTTYMNPHVECGQIIPGKRNYGRRAGINEMRFLPNVIDATELLHGSLAWTPERNNALKKWFGQYLQWLDESEHGKKERARPNNHGTWYDVQYVSIALYLENKELARQILEAHSKNRIAGQIDSTGMQPLEVSRGFSLHYSIYNTKAFFALAVLANRVGIDLWNYKAENGANLQLALNYVMPYVGNQQNWPHHDYGRDLGKSWCALLSQAACRYKLFAYTKALQKAETISEEKYHYCHRLVVPCK